jgi:Ca2+-binding RTX toxin-like protein
VHVEREAVRPTTGTDYIYGGAGNDTLTIDNKFAEVKLNRSSDGSWRIFYPITGDTECQSASNRDLLSARKRDPLAVVGIG